VLFSRANLPSLWIRLIYPQVRGKQGANLQDIVVRRQQRRAREWI